MAEAAVTGMSAWLRQHCGGVWQTLLEHPFVRDLAAGTLPLEAFCHYIEQDILFLDDYARAIGLAVGRAADEDELRELARLLSIVVEEEIEQERVLLRRVEEMLGRPSAPTWRATPTTQAYSSFLLATAARGDALDVMTALLPCVWSYAEIGRAHLATTIQHPVYTDWMRLFGSGDYQQYLDRRLASYDRFSAGVLDTRRERLLELFLTATRLEAAFWDMAYNEED